MAAVEQGTPGRLTRLAARAPLRLYQLKLGWLLGERFLRLEHVGRKSGLARHCVLEVVDHDPETGSYTVASGWGRTSQWFQNVTANPAVRVTVGLRTWPARAMCLDRDAAAQAFCRYAAKHPTAFRKLTKFMLGAELDATEASARRLAEVVPAVALVP